MCGSQGNDCCCCPEATIFQEKICGNFGAIDAVVWQAPVAPAENDYIQGTFEVFNAGTGPVLFTVNGQPTPPFSVPPGTSQTISVNNPTRFVIQTTGFEGAVPGTHGKWCITLYKRVFA